MRSTANPSLARFLFCSEQLTNSVAQTTVSNDLCRGLYFADISVIFGGRLIFTLFFKVGGELADTWYVARHVLRELY